MKHIYKITFTALIVSAALASASAFAQDKLTVEQAFITSDIDRSGSISQSEFMAFLEKGESKTPEQSATDFATLDTNKDGKLTLEELESSKTMFPHTVQ